MADYTQVDTGASVPPRHDPPPNPEHAALVEFLRVVLPAAPCYYAQAFKPLVSGERQPQRARRLNSREELADYLFAQDRAGLSVYFSTAGFIADAPNRKATSVARLQALRLDIDCGIDHETGKTKAYPDQQAGLAALTALMQALGLTPLIVDSGNGLHVYLLLDAPITRGEWQLLADQLGEVCATAQLHVDAQVTTDAARILRPINTFNRKNPANPKQVRYWNGAVTFTRYTAGALAAVFTQYLDIHGGARPARRANGHESKPIPGKPCAAFESMNVENLALNNEHDWTLSHENLRLVWLMLVGLDPREFATRAAWMRIVWAVLSLGWGETGYKLVRKWSEAISRAATRTGPDGKPGVLGSDEKLHAGFHEAALKHVWNTGEPGKGVTIGTLVWHAQQRGWNWSDAMRQAGFPDSEPQAEPKAEATAHPGANGYADGRANGTAQNCSGAAAGIGEDIPRGDSGGSGTTHPPQGGGSAIGGGKGRKKNGLVQMTAKELFDLFVSPSGKTVTVAASPLADLVRANEMSGNIELQRPPPWRAIGPRYASDVLWEDADDARCQIYFEEAFKRYASLTEIRTAVSAAAVHLKYNPVRDYLNSLAWDGVPRLARFFVDCCEAEDNVYTCAVARVFFVGAVARIMRPGVKHDIMPILEGDQGAYKSTLFRVLVGDTYFSDAAPDLSRGSGRDIGELMRGVWIVEFSELSGFGTAHINRVKHFLSQQSDRYRAAYARSVRDYPRMCVTVGTTNPDANGKYLKDTTGNRRFLPLSVGRCNVESVRAMRDQLWAEAVVLYKQGMPHWLTAEEAETLRRAKQEAEKRVERSPFYEMMLEHVEFNSAVPRLKSAEVYAAVTGRTYDRATWQEQRDIGAVMRKAGRKTVQEKGRNVWVLDDEASHAA
ncbi:virulence-associated E family protein [Caballeronia choica]|uniref:Virulence-associated E family protein n=1 Tax=Caballeronia choica TaxID=326476 RepID=A0A158KPG1_9BURK|nr:VapE domain-containing protein [Caballeronia choica]SAL82480.1 virulence-associated E family protein [Caballeronia choica]